LVNFQLWSFGKIKNKGIVYKWKTRLNNDTPSQDQTSFYVHTRTGLRKMFEFKS
jgi:hypothetical protein